MEKQFEIKGMTCMGCVATVKKILNDQEGVIFAEVRLEYPQVTITSSKDLDLRALDLALGKYSISAIENQEYNPEVSDVAEANLETYRPLILIALFILGITLLAQYPFDGFSGMKAMQHFMAGFFLAFSFFKLLDIPAFANSFAMYDIIAKKWRGYGYVYPFIELLLGVAFLIGFELRFMNILVIVVLGLGTVGVVESNLNKRKIQCACLGTVFNLPMTKVTIIENVSMILMAIAMLII